MDVVRENIEAIGGSISLSSTLGQGTCFSIKIPLTLAIAPAQSCKREIIVFALPQVSVVEAVGLGPGAAHNLEHIQGAKVLRLRPARRRSLRDSRDGSVPSRNRKRAGAASTVNSRCSAVC